MKKIKGLECILLIDDEEVNNYLNTILIGKTKIDIHVEVTLNGKMALEYLTCTGKYSRLDCYPQPGLIFLDINMPLMNGWEFLEEYEKLDDNKKGGIVVTMLSSSNNPDDIIRAKKLGSVVDYISKPLTSKKLEEIIYTFFPINKSINQTEDI